MSMEQKSSLYRPEIWGGIECTINRVGDEYRDQLSLSGHYDRKDDLEAIAGLGIKALRYPVLWEKHHGPKPDFSWAAQQLESIRDYGIEPIVGLLHHGSGPGCTSLDDPDFATRFEAYAQTVASEFPWITYYTPVNEPLTTARFSGLYGLWYPHLETEPAFLQIFINQLKGVVLAMQAVRKINPSAKLVQTEDLCFTHSTSSLAYQAAFENNRRWLTIDFLCGAVDEKHFFWEYFSNHGIPESDLRFFLENKCPPDIIGFNYYVTSERFLDENLDAYPEFMHGGNGRHKYVDTEAVRIQKCAGLKTLLQQAWDRYGIALAVTECHISCTREEQLRWFSQNYKDCCELAEAGVDVRAITAWSLLGAYDWNSLLTKKQLHYESGAFDVTGKTLRPTALAGLIRSLAVSGTSDSPLIQGEGWWSMHDQSISKNAAAPVRSIMIIGRTGTLGSAFQHICNFRKLKYVSLTRDDVNILDEDSIRKAVSVYKPWAIVNATGFVRVDDAEHNPEECFEVNAVAPALMAKVARENGIGFVSFSSDLVFDGYKSSPYREDDETCPINIYGETKMKGETMILDINPASLVIRTSAFFGPWDRYNFVYAVLNAVKTGTSMEIPDDVMISPTYVPDLCNTALDLLMDQEMGIWHISNSGITSWAEFGDIIASTAGYSNNVLNPTSSAEMNWAAKRPLYSVLESGKGVKLPDFQNALGRYFEHLTV